jgi:hypothetical protein
MTPLLTALTLLVFGFFALRAAWAIGSSPPYGRHLVGLVLLVVSAAGWWFA